jgi:hypothetical protein
VHKTIRTGVAVNPSADQINKWADFSQEAEGWVRIPLSSWPDLLWCLRHAERAEKAMATMRVEISHFEAGFSAAGGSGR